MVGREKAKHWGPPEARGPAFVVGRNSGRGPSGTRGPVPENVGRPGSATPDRAGRPGQPPRPSVGPGRPRQAAHVAQSDSLVRQSAWDGRAGPRVSRGPDTPPVSQSESTAAGQAGRAVRRPRAAFDPARPGRAKRAARASRPERQSARIGGRGPRGSRGPTPGSVGRSGTTAAGQAGRAGRPHRATVGHSDGPCATGY